MSKFLSLREGMSIRLDDYRAKAVAGRGEELTRRHCDSMIKDT